MTWRPCSSFNTCHVYAAGDAQQAQRSARVCFGNERQMRVRQCASIETTLDPPAQTKTFGIFSFRLRNGARALGVINRYGFSGMHGLAAMKAMGAHEDEKSSTIFGMPGRAEAGLTDEQRSTSWPIALACPKTEIINALL